MKKYFILLLLIIIFSLSACSNSNQTEAGKQGKVITFGHEYNESHSLHAGAVKFKEKLEELSDGEITVEIHNNGSLGDNEEMHQQLLMGNLDAHISNVVFYTGEHPQAMVDELPFIYQEVSNWYDAWDGEFGGAIQSEVFDQAGVTNLGNWGVGFRHFTNNVRPITTPEDMEGIKFRSASSPIRLKMFEVLGGNAISMPLPELFTGLQQGTVDGMDNPLITIESGSFEEVQDYLSLSGHIFTGMNVLFNTDNLNSFTEEEQDWIQTAMDGATSHQRNVTAENEEKILESFESVIEINEVDYDAFLNAVQPVYDYYREEFGDNGWIEMIQEVQ
ncbi:TRAP transporter substrate-binding protein [Oceanobacillus saliphilus]|uniref:TRAP transporter substrate-binding protein n=1 Tax=Oceanobacillus saliphilus TaxID=2925834 RepID=UPI00201DFCAB|nr:TRAP transporter substrate-binding protein [Oceanobacillus saliphilus]